MAMPVSVLKREFGMVITVFVNQDSLDLTVLAARLNNIGMKRLNLVFVKPH